MESIFKLMHPIGIERVAKQQDMYVAEPPVFIPRAVPYSFAVLLCLLGICVLVTWHIPRFINSIDPATTFMAYNSALGFCTCALGLFSALIQSRPLKNLSLILLVVIVFLTLLDLFTELPVNTSTWFAQLFNEPLTRNQSVPPTACAAFLCAALAIQFGFKEQGVTAVISFLMCIVIVFIILAALLGQGFTALPTFVWLGIEMAPLTALGFVLFTAGFISLRIGAAVEAFNRFKVFSRLITGFIAMSLLFVGIGAIGSLQINNVVSITQELYEDPVQTNNAALRIKVNVGSVNRQLKDIAVDPNLADAANTPETIKGIQQEIVKEIALIGEKNSRESAARLSDTFNQWRLAIVENHDYLETGDIDAYRAKTLTEIQELTIALEQLCEEIIQQSQQRILELNNDVLLAKKQAGNLMFIVLCGFLLTGVLVAALITRSLTFQLYTISGTMEKLAEGDTHVPIPYLDHPHEIGIIGHTLQVFAENMEARKQSAALLLKHQADLEAANQRLAQTNKELETFAYVASHDLKSPLRGIAQLSTWIEEDLAAGENAEVEKHTRMLRNRIQRMERLLDDMLVFYRAGKVDGKLASVDVRHMATELFDIQNTKPGLRLELGETLPEFETLATPFEQVLRNLFSNAIKHHDKPEGVIQLDCDCSDEQFYYFSVTDDGPGIPEQFHERIFGMFQTLKPRDELEGSGMGLTLIKKLVETYGGSIHVFSAGRGTRFTFSWPRFIKEKIKP